VGSKGYTIGNKTKLPGQPRLNRSDVSASAETRHQKCTQMYTFDDAQQRSRCPPLVSTVEKTIRKPFENSGAGYKAQSE